MSVSGDGNACAGRTSTRNTPSTGSPRLHTNFTINENGGYLALVAPESPRAVVTQYPPNYNEFAIPPVTDAYASRGVASFPSLVPHSPW